MAQKKVFVVRRDGTETRKKGVLARRALRAYDVAID